METNIQTNNTQNSSVTNSNEASVNNPGHSQAQVAGQATVENQATTQVNPTPGPDAAFAAMRQENERLAREAASAKAIAEDEGVRQFIAQREAQKLADEAKAKGLSVEANRELAELKATQEALIAQQTQAAAANNLRSFAGKFQMDQNDLQTFAQWMDNTHPQMSDMASVNPNFDFTPYLAAFNPQEYANFSGAQNKSVPSPVYVPGHGSATGATQVTDNEALMARIKEVAKID